GFFSYPISYKFYWLFVDGSPLFNETEPALLFWYPWLFLVIPGVIFLVRKEGVAGAAVLTAWVFNLMLYVNYNDLLPSDIYRFNLIHYLTWWFPLMFLLAFVACRHGWKYMPVRIGFGMAALIFVLAIG